MKLIHRWWIWKSQWTRRQSWFLAVWTLLWLLALAAVDHKCGDLYKVVVEQNKIILAHGWEGKP